MAGLRTYYALAAFAAIVALCPLAGPARAGTWVRADPQFQVKGCSATVFTDPEYKGASWRTTNSWAVVGWEFKNQISSIKIHSGVWQFFKGDHFDGQIETLFPGNYAHLKPSSTNVIASFRCERAT